MPLINFAPTFVIAQTHKRQLISFYTGQVLIPKLRAEHETPLIDIFREQFGDATKTNYQNQAMETDALWKPWKSKLHFPTVPTTLGKLEKDIEFPTVPTASTTR